MERSKTGTNKTSPDGLSHPNQNTIIINKISRSKKWEEERTADSAGIVTSQDGCHCRL